MFIRSDNKDSIKDILCEIDKQLSQQGSIKYKNEAYYLNDEFNVRRWEALVLYRDVLQHRLFCEEYTPFPIDTIISQAKQYIHGK